MISIHNKKQRDKQEKQGKQSKIIKKQKNRHIKRKKIMKTP